jgi:hypothetical protein
MNLTHNSSINTLEIVINALLGFKCFFLPDLRNIAAIQVESRVP